MSKMWRTADLQGLSLVFQKHRLLHLNFSSFVLHFSTKSHIYSRPVPDAAISSKPVTPNLGGSNLKPSGVRTVRIKSNFRGSTRLRLSEPRYRFFQTDFCQTSWVICAPIVNLKYERIKRDCSFSQNDLRNGFVMECNGQMYCKTNVIWPRLDSDIWKQQKWRVEPLVNLWYCQEYTKRKQFRKYDPIDPLSFQ